jgi:hypothetical protein
MGFDRDPEAIVHHFFALSNAAKVAALGIDAIFDEMGPRDVVREEQFATVIRWLFTIPNGESIQPHSEEKRLETDSEEGMG